MYPGDSMNQSWPLQTSDCLWGMRSQGQVVSSEMLIKSMETQCKFIFACFGPIENKLGLNWAKLSSSWDWALLQSTCIKLMSKKYYWVD